MQASEDLAGLKIERRSVRSYKGRRFPVKTVLLLLLVAAAAAAFGNSFLAGPLVELGPVCKASALSPSANGDKPGAWTELNAAGYVVADRQSTVAAKFTSRLQTLHVREAQKVKKSDVLAELDHTELDALIVQQRAEAEQAAAQTQQSAAQVLHAAAQVEQSRSAAAEAEAELAAAQAPLETHDATIRELEVALVDAQRRQSLDVELVKKNATAASSGDDRATEVRMAEARIATARRRKVEAELQIAVSRTRAGSARAAIATADAQVKAMEAARDSAASFQKAMEARVKVLEAQRDDYFVRAPFDGVVTERIAEEGEIVAPVSMGGTMAKGAIVTIADWDSLQAEVDVAEAYLERVQPGGRAAITVDAIPNRVFPGRVQRILPRADRSKATVQVRVDFLDKGGVFLPDMGVRVKFLPADAPEGAERGLVPDPLVIAATAVKEAGGARFVWLVKDGRAVKRPVETGAARGDHVEIRTGLELGERVVVAGSESIAEDGQRVRVKE